MRDVPARSLLLLDFLFLKINRKCDMSYAVIGECRPTSQVRNVLDMRRAHNAFVEHGDIHEELVEGDILLGVCTDKIVKLKTGDRQYWLSVELGIVEPIQKMNP